MAAVVVCPACGGRLRVGDSVTPGSVVRCAYCSQGISIRSVAPSRPLPGLPGPVASPLDPLGPPRRRKQDRTALYVVAGVSGGLVLLLSVALILALSGRREVASDSEQPASTAAAPTEAGEGGALDVPAVASEPSGQVESPGAASHREPSAEIAEPDSTESLETEAQAARAPAAEGPASADVAQSEPGRYGPRRPPSPPRVSLRPSPDPSQPSAAAQSPSLTRSPSTPVIPLEELPEAVARSKESVCIIEHPLGSGTGFVVGQNVIATNAHVVDGAYVEELECHFSSAGVLKCRASRVLYEDAVRDLCLLEVNTDQAPIPIVADHVFRRGEKVVIIGNPALGDTDIVLRDAVMGGTINAVVHTDSCDFYQIDASVNPGSSGGPVLNLDGQVVGVVAMKATERGASEIRRALRTLDDSFAAHFNTAARKGIAFGIPVGALSQAIGEVRGQSESAASRVGDRHMARVLLGRMSILGGLQLLRLHLNVPLGVRQQASRINLRNVPTSTLNKIKLIPLIPEYIAIALARELGSEEVRKMVRVSSVGLETKVRHLRDSDHFDEMAARNLESLLRAVLETKNYAERPPGTYQAFSQAVYKQADKLKTLIRRLTDQLEVAEAAYSD